MRCWLCRHPMPAGPVSAPPDVVPSPPLYHEAEDKTELDTTSLVIFIGLVAATFGALGVNGPLRNFLGGVALLPLCYLFYWITSDRGRPSESQDGLRKFFRSAFLVVCAIVLVPVAVIIALAATCAVIFFGIQLAT